MFWNELEGAYLFNKVFSKPISIGKVDLFSVKIERDGPSVLIEFDLLEALPDNPLPRWQSHYNRCRCGLICAGVKTMQISGIATNMEVDVSIQDNSKLIMKGLGFSLELECIYMHLSGPSVYLTGQ
mgnify:FL=1